MTAREIVNAASELTFDTSMLRVVQARKDLRMIADAITGEQIRNDWRDANDHLDNIEQEMADRMQAGVVVRIV